MKEFTKRSLELLGYMADLISEADKEIDKVSAENDRLVGDVKTLTETVKRNNAEIVKLMTEKEAANKQSDALLLTVKDKMLSVVEESATAAEAASFINKYFKSLIRNTDGSTCTCVCGDKEIDKEFGDVRIIKVIFT